MKKVVGIGACVLDTLIACNAYPNEDIKYRANSTTKTGGGPVAMHWWCWRKWAYRRNSLVRCLQMQMVTF